MKLSIKLSREQVKQAALADAGIRGADLGHRRSMQRHKSLREQQRRGVFKHKHRCADF